MSRRPTQGTGQIEPMPPVFGPVSPSCAFLKSVHGGSTTWLLPSLRPKIETSQPSRNSSTRTRSLAQRRRAEAERARQGPRIPGRPCLPRGRSSSPPAVWPSERRRRLSKRRRVAVLRGLVPWACRCGQGMPSRTPCWTRAAPRIVARADRGYAVCLQDVHHAGRERRLGTHEHAVYGVRAAGGQHGGRVQRVHAGHVGGNLARASVAGSAEDRAHPAAPRKLPRHGMLTAARAKHEDLHEAFPLGDSPLADGPLWTARRSRPGAR